MHSCFSERNVFIRHQLEKTSYQIPERAISKEQLQQMAKLSGVLRIKNQYFENYFKNRCHQLIEQPRDLDTKHFLNIKLSIKKGLNLEILNVQILILYVNTLNLFCTLPLKKKKKMLIFEIK